MDGVVGRRVTGIVLVIVGLRVWWLCVKMPSGSLDGWALAIAGVGTMLMGIYRFFNLPLGGGKA